MIQEVTPYNGTQYAFCPECSATTVVAYYDEENQPRKTICPRCAERDEEVVVVEEVADDDDAPLETFDEELAHVMSQLGTRLTACKTLSCIGFTNLSCSECGLPTCAKCLDNYDLCPHCAAEYGHILKTRRSRR